MVRIYLDEGVHSYWIAVGIHYGKVWFLESWPINDGM